MNPVIFILIDPNSWIIIHFLSFESIDIAYDFLLLLWMIDKLVYYSILLCNGYAVA